MVRFAWIANLEEENVSKIISFPAKGDASPSSDLRVLRMEYGLSISQAAEALLLSVANLEDMEKGLLTPDYTDVEIRQKYEFFIGINGIGEDSNLIFHTTPLRQAREALQMSVEQMASAYGYSTEEWFEFELNSKPLPKDILAKIEEDVREV